MAATLGLQFGKRRMSSQTNPVQLVHRRGRPDTLNKQGPSECKPGHDTNNQSHSTNRGQSIAQFTNMIKNSHNT